MLKIAGMIAVFMLLSQPALAQDQNTNIPKDKKVVDGKFIAVTVLLAGTTIFDLESTHRFIEDCPAGRVCREANSALRPFIEGGRLSSYSLQFSIDMVITYLAYMLKEDNKKYWWVPPVVVSTVHGAAGVWNVKVRFSF